MNQLPAHLQNRQRRDLASSAMGGLNTGRPPHISIAGNRFTLIDAAGNQRPIQMLYLDVCVIDANASVSKIYYDPRVPYDPSAAEGAPPICWSDNGVGASSQASQPQSQSCSLCPHNAWGSATSQMTGKQTKACNDAKKLAVMVPGIPDQVFLLRVPPASLKNLAKYTQTLLGHGVDLPDALTRLEFESQGVLKFTPVGYVDEQTATATDAVLAKNATDMLVGRNDRPWTGPADAAKVEYAQRQVLAPPPPAPGFAGTPVPPPQPMAQAMQAQPFGAPPAGAMGASPFAPAGMSSPPAATQAQAGPTPRKRGPNKPKTEPAPAPTSPPFMPAPPAAAMPDLPDFLQQGAPPAPQPPPVPSFGMQANPPAPDAGMQAALDAAFKLPT